MLGLDVAEMIGWLGRSCGEVDQLTELGGIGGLEKLRSL